MTNNLKQHKNYTESSENYQLVLPLCLEGLIPDDDSVRMLIHGTFTHPEELKLPAAGTLTAAAVPIKTNV